MKHKMNTEQKIEILRKDFLDRDGETFVKIRKDGRLGWEATLSGGAYSDYMLHPRSVEELISNAYRMASDMIKVMDAPFPVEISITGDTSCTDAKTVCVATKVFDDADLSVGVKLDTFIGLAVHEGCHLLYTDFGANGEAENGIVHSLQNIIEDERIERVCGQAKPGLANFLKSSKYYYFDKYWADMLKAGKMSGLDTFQRLMNSIIAYVRYPKSLDGNDMREFADVLLEAREALVPYPESTAESLVAARRIYDAMKDWLRQQEQQKASGGSKAGQVGESDGNPSEGGQPQEGQQGQGGQTAESAPDQPTDIEQGMEKSLQGMEQALSNITRDPGQGGLGESEKSEAISRDGGRVGKCCEGRMEMGTQKGTYVTKGTDDKDKYLESLSRVKCHVPAIAKVIRCSSTEYKYNLHGMRSGLLDTGKLAEAFQGVPTVYLRQGEVRSDRVAVCILIDESGSMWGDGETAARDTAVLLNEALSRQSNVDLYIYGHTASRSATDLYVYREKGFSRRYALGSTDSRAGNHDSIAIREAAARVRRQTSEKVLFFVISDGAPNESTELVRKAVLDVEKDGFNVVAISIDPYYDPSTMYSRNVNLSDMSTLAVDLGKLVRKAVMDNTKKHLNI